MSFAFASRISTVADRSPLAIANRIAFFSSVVSCESFSAAALAYLDDHIGRGVKPGLERISGLLDLLATPQSGYPILHIAGTNGKTSTARMAATLIAAHGLAPGLFTSPHLHRVEERFEYGLDPMTADQFAEAMGELAPIADLFEERSGEAVTYFELTAALAFSWFASMSVDVAVVETGLGGRLDATNAATSDVAVVTSIGLEHTDYLGDTVELIGAEKLAILNAGSALVTGDLPPSVVAMAEEAARAAGASWFAWGTDVEPIDPVQSVGGWSFDLRSPMAEYEDVVLRVHGRHQVTNFAIAVASVEALFGRALDPDVVRSAAATVTVPGRMEVVGRDPLVLLDGAHNPHATAALSAALAVEFPTTTWELIFGVMGDKDIEGMLAPLRGRVDRALVTAADSPRAMAPEDLAAIVAAELDVPVETRPTVAAAMATRSDEAATLVTGSIYVVGEARAALGL